MNDVPSGTFRFSVREVTFGVELKRSELLPDATVTYVAIGTMVEPSVTDAQKVSVEVWLGVDKVEMKNEEGEFEPLTIDLDDDGYYERERFVKWVNKRSLADVLAMHTAVLEAVPNWKRLGLSR